MKVPRFLFTIAVIALQFSLALIIGPFEPKESVAVAIVGIVMILAYMLVHLIECLNASEYDFACVSCGKRFFVKPGKLYVRYCGYFTLGTPLLHTAVLKCPACEKKGICYMPDFYPADFKPPSNWRG